MDSEEQTPINGYAIPSGLKELLRMKVQDKPVEASLTNEEKRHAERNRILSAMIYCKYDDEWIDSDDAREPCCPACGANDKYHNEVNRKRVWLGIGPDEFCQVCGAEPEQQNSLYSCRENWSIPQLLTELASVNEVYESYQFMSRTEVLKNREYFSSLISAIQISDQDYWKDRHAKTLENRHRSELRDAVVEVAAMLNGGDRELAMNEYGGVSREIDDIYFILDDLKARLAAANELNIENI